MSEPRPIVKDYMTKAVITVKEDEDVYAAIQTLLNNKISGAPVLDSESNLVGILSEKDCLRIFSNGMFHNFPGASVKDYMSKEVLTITPDADIFTATDILLNNVFRRMPVVEEDKLLGIISRRDVLKAIRDAFDDENMQVPHDTEEKKEYLSPEMKGILGDDGLS